MGIVLSSNLKGFSRAESDGVVGPLVRSTLEESGAAGLVVSIDVGPRAARLEVIVVGNTYVHEHIQRLASQSNKSRWKNFSLTGGRALVGGAELTRATVPRVGLVSIQVGEACRLASDREARRVKGTLERSRA